MSMNRLPSTLLNANRIRVLGAAIECRRRQLGLTIECAAALSGVAVSEWFALEDGAWVPDDPGVIRAIAATLEANWVQVSFLALVASQQKAA